MGRILAISSQVVYGPVGNTAAVPAMQAMGHEVMQVPTVLLSHHPGHGKPVGQATPPHLFESLLNSASEAGAFDFCEAVLTGYFASAEQVQIAAEWIRRIGAQTVLVDTVLGDNHGLYVKEEIAIAIRDHLIPEARIITPNLFELGWLTQTDPATEDEIADSVRRLEREVTIVTSAPSLSANQIGTLMFAGNGRMRIDSPLYAKVPHGTGDFLAGLILGSHLKKDIETAFGEAMGILNHAIHESAGTPVLSIARALAK
jgi:pyridoxine kinase